MMPEYRALSVVGVRPQFVKAAEVASAFTDSAPDVDHRIVLTGQHHSPTMARDFYEGIGLAEPARVLDINGGSNAEMTARMMLALEGCYQDEVPDIVLVYGDTNSTLAGALCAAQMNISVAHVEAGLRCFDTAVPEEVIRVTVDHLSDLLFAPTTHAVENLGREGIGAGVHLVGDVMFDAAQKRAIDDAAMSRTLDARGLSKGEYALLTVHRAENTCSPEALARVLGFAKQAAAGIPVLFPIHPRTRAAIERFGVDPAPLALCDPVGHAEMLALIAGAATIMSDSGGIQKEAYYARVPCITLRTCTEWPETIDAGWNVLFKDYERTDDRPRKNILEYEKTGAAGVIADHVVAFVKNRRG